MTPEQRKHFEFVRDEMHGEPKQEPPPIGFITNARHRLNFEPNATGLKDMPKTIDWKIPVYVSPQQRTWVGLKDEECREIREEANLFFQPEETRQKIVQELVEAKLKEKNT